MALGNIGILGGGGDCETDVCSPVTCDILCDDGSFAECFDGKRVQIVVGGVGTTPGDDCVFDDCDCPTTANGTYCCTGGFLNECEVVYNGGLGCTEPPFAGHGVATLYIKWPDKIWIIASNNVFINSGTGLTSGFAMWAELDDEAVKAAVNLLCSGGGLSLPMFEFYPAEPCSCDFSGATAVATLIDAPCPDEPPPPPPEGRDCTGFVGCDPMMLNVLVEGLEECVFDDLAGTVTTYSYQNLNGFYVANYDSATEPTCTGSSGGFVRLFKKTLGVAGDFDNAGDVLVYTEGPDGYRHLIAVYEIVFNVECFPSGGDPSSTMGIVSMTACGHQFTWDAADPPGTLVYDGAFGGFVAATIDSTTTPIVIDCDGNGGGEMVTTFDYVDCQGDHQLFTVTGNLLGGID